jgi:hypothetical protein
MTNSNLKYTQGAPFRFGGTGSNRPKLQITNSLIKSSQLVIVSLPLDVQVSNSHLDLSGDLQYMADGANLYYMSSNCVYDHGVSLHATTGPRVVRLNFVDGAYEGLLSALTPAIGDFLRSINATDTEGIYFYKTDGPAWEKVAG